MILRCRSQGGCALPPTYSLRSERGSRHLLKDFWILWAKIIGRPLSRFARSSFSQFWCLCSQMILREKGLSRCRAVQSRLWQCWRGQKDHQLLSAFLIYFPNFCLKNSSQSAILVIRIIWYLDYAQSSDCWWIGCLVEVCPWMDPGRRVAGHRVQTHCLEEATWGCFHMIGTLHDG